jgi:hypothetical protein
MRLPPTKKHRNGEALTLLELLLCIAIVAFLFGLIGGAVQKARHRADLKIYQAAMPRVFPAVREDLQRFYSDKTNYRAWSATEMHKMGVFDRQLMRWIKNGWVIYHPFSSADAGNHLVIDFYEHTEPNGVKVWRGLSISHIVKNDTE